MLVEILESSRDGSPVHGGDGSDKGQRYEFVVLHTHLYSDQHTKLLSAQVAEISNVQSAHSEQPDKMIARNAHSLVWGETQEIILSQNVVLLKMQ